MTVRTAQTAKTSHRGSERPAWGRHRVQKDFLSGGSKGDRLHRDSHLGTSVTLNVARIKLIRSKTFEQRRNFEFISKDQVRHHRSAGGRDVRHGARPPWHGVLSVPLRQPPQYDAERQLLLLLRLWSQRRCH